MSNFSPNEHALIQSITNDALKTSLILIRNAMRSIWTPEVRIIRGYTDHGEPHSIRIVGFVNQLLKAHEGQPLNEIERYLLLCGIYLHDIGMQCDVTLLRPVKEGAESLGAKFDVDIQSATANDYTNEEQIAIRKNHHYLSAAWIKYAYSSGESVLAPAAKSIPQNYVQDVMDVCLHHTKLPIGGCQTTLTLGGSDRKQFVAALLRFADELDIEASRVSISTVNNFNLPPSNALYWWLHHNTEITFSSTSSLKITVQLHPDDFVKYGALIREKFITEFQNKNRPVVDVLHTNNLKLAFDAESNVVSYGFAEKLPSDIVRVLLSGSRKSHPTQKIAEETKTWLRAIRYEVSEAEIVDDRTSDMQASLEQGTVKQRVLIRCISDEIQASDVTKLYGKLSMKIPEGWLIGQTRIANSAHEKASEDEYKDNIKVFCFNDFLSREVWAPYISSITALVERDQVPNKEDLYVDIGCYKINTDDEDLIVHDRYPSLDQYIDLWLKEDSAKHISLLGEFGTGKTWFCRHYALRQLKRYLENPLVERFPLLVTLRSFAKAMTAQQLINDALLVQYSLPFIGNPYEVFDQLNRNGKLLLILDGFDEMARQVDQQTVIDNFWELATLVSDNSKVILTSRTEYFRQSKDSTNILGGLEYGRKTVRLEPPKFEVIHLEPFTEIQIRQVITKRIAPIKGNVIAEQTTERILSNKNLAELARKPILVELLLAAIDEVSIDILKSPAQVYLYATNKLLLRNIETQRTFTKTADKLFFLCEIAWQMIKSGDLRINFKDIPNHINTYFHEQIKDKHQLDMWDFDLRNQTLLHRDAAGYYEFAHKSLAEYFVALKFAAEISCLPSIVTQTYVELGDKKCVFPIKSLVETNWIDLGKTFGTSHLLTPRFIAVFGFLKDILQLDEANVDRLWRLIYGTRTRQSADLTIPTRQVNVIGANAFNLLVILRSPMMNTDLRTVNLEGIILRGVDLRGADFSGSSISDLHIWDADLRNTNFHRVGFDNIVLWEDSIRCAGMNLQAATGIPNEALDMLAKGGAILDVSQKKRLKKYRDTNASSS